ncbi:hypothetical protein ES703_86754 [subsurface metagenome]
MLFALLAVNGSGTGLGDIRYTVELCAVAPFPYWGDLNRPAVFCVSLQLFRNNGECASDASETGGFGKTAKLYGDFLCTINLIYRMRYVGVGDKRLVSSVKKNDGLIFACIIDPFFQLLFCRDSTSRVVRKTQVNQIDLFLGQVRYKIILFGTGHINNAFVPALLGWSAGSAGHNVGVHIYRIDGV